MKSNIHVLVAFVLFFIILSIVAIYIQSVLLLPKEIFVIVVLLSAFASLLFVWTMERVPKKEKK